MENKDQSQANVTTAATESTSASKRNIPISPPSEPRQYRAIGLVRGQYFASAEQTTKGVLVADDGTKIDAVLLGRVISLVKNHLDLNESYLWVVYPRTRQDEDQLHVQIVGVWEPEKLQADEDVEPEPGAIVEDGYFSIRGEAVFCSAEAWLSASNS
jgi:hypothetical protein